MQPRNRESYQAATDELNALISAAPPAAARGRATKAAPAEAASGAAPAGETPDGATPDGATPDGATPDGPTPGPGTRPAARPRKATGGRARPAGQLDLAALSDELLAVAQVLAKEPRLRRALADPARDADARVELLESLLSGKVSDGTVRLARVLVRQRWSTPGELLDATERLAVDAQLAAAERDGALADVEDELFRFGQVVDANPDLSATLSDPIAPVAQRAHLLGDLLDGKARPATVWLARLALSGFGGRGFSASLSRLVELTAARQEQQVAYVTAAVPLTDADEQRLGARLSEMYGRGVSVKVTVDPRIIGGLSVQVGSDLYDGTVLRRLTEARTALTK